MTLGQLLRQGKDRLKAAQIEEWDLDAWYLLEYISGCTKSEYLLDPGKELSNQTERQYEELIQKRSLHIPLQHLTGSQEFMGLSFCVNKDVLIPRQDTEILVETALSHIKEGMHILDLCTGSGCILLSILKLGPDITGTGSDLSEKALKIAKKNQENLGVEARLLQSDLFHDITGEYDCILSNPPYIPSKVVDTLMEEVRVYEPRLALDGREDGLYYYREIIKQSPKYLKPEGMLFFEIGYDQARDVSSLMNAAFCEIHVVKDLSGLDRVVYGRLKS